MSGFGKFGCTTAIAFALTACGGGGGGSTNSTPRPPLAPGPTSLPSPMPIPVTPPSSENFDTPEYQNSSAAVGSNAIGAWEKGATGKGITIGFVDTGLVATLSDFVGRIHPQSRDVEGNRPMEDVYGHGTAIAGIAAAARDGVGMQGIAFESTIFMAKADHGCPSNCQFARDATGDGIDAARTAGATVINLSMAGDGGSEIWEAATRAINAGIIIVISAGNSGSAPSPMASKLASLAPDQVMIVGGLGKSNPDGTINYDHLSIYSAPAGSSQSSFLAAPGWLNSATYFKDGGIDRLSGSSFASPVVAGAVALIAQAFPMLTPQQMVLLLYVTADDLGAIGTDSVFGRGRLNIGRAFQPVGATKIAGTSIAPPVSIGALPSAAGDAASRGGLTATVLDEFNRPFNVDLAKGLAQLVEPGLLYRSIVAGQHSIHSAIGPISLAFAVDSTSMRSKAFKDLGLTPFQETRARLFAATAISKLADGSFVGFGFGTGLSELRHQLGGRTTDALTLSDNATQRLGFTRRNPNSIALEQEHEGWRISFGGERGVVTNFRSRQLDARYALLGLSVDRKLLRGQMRLGVTRLMEQRTVLGGSIDSMFGKLGSQTWYADAEIDQQMGNGWSVFGSYRRGRTTFANGQFTTSALSMGITKMGMLTHDDTLAFRLSQPLRIETGTLELLLPVSWDYKLQVADEAHQRLSLSPSGRELILEAAYRRNIARGWFSLNLYGRREPDHVRHNNHDAGLAVRANLTL